MTCADALLELWLALERLALSARAAKSSQLVPFAGAACAWLDVWCRCSVKVKK